MAVGPRLDLRQTQNLVITPQLQQAIKLLALSNLELESFISEALDANPLLEVDGVRQETTEAGGDEEARPTEERAADRLLEDGHGEEDRPLDIDPAAIDRDRETGDGSWSGAGPAAGEDLPSIEERQEDAETLAEHLHAQVGAQAGDAREEFIARQLIDQLDEAGYLASGLSEIANGLGVPLAEAERALAVVQSLDPTGVGARSLAECLALQAREADRYDPCMARMIDNLDLLARGEIPRLRRLCEVDDEDFADMLAELRSYDPKPGLRFGGSAEQAIVPDILLRRADEGGWRVTLNQETLPRLVVNRSYYVELREGSPDKAARRWLNEKLADANWLLKALDQRQKTILKVAGEIVKQQDGFFRRGVSGLRPLTLREVGEAIDMHESTVSRVTSNKYLHCERGTFELKFFFTSGVAASSGDGTASSEAVKSRIKALIEGESAKAILSDDKLVELLREEGFDLARRTVAKYREALGIGSSVQRRRQKKLEAAGAR